MQIHRGISLFRRLITTIHDEQTPETKRIRVSGTGRIPHSLLHCLAHGIGHQKGLLTVHIQNVCLSFHRLGCRLWQHKMFAKVKKMHFDISPSYDALAKDACVGSSDNSDRDPIAVFVLAMSNFIDMKNQNVHFLFFFLNDKTT